jgi:hypothetical protein
MKKIREFYNKYIKKDGILHIVVCFGITMCFGMLVHPAFAAFIALFIGFMKEIVWDGYMDKGEFEWKDIIFDLIGSLLGFALLMIIKLIL